MSTDREIAKAARAFVAARLAYDARDRDELLLVVLIDAAWALLVDAVNDDETVDTPPL